MTEAPRGGGAPAAHNGALVFDRSDPEFANGSRGGARRGRAAPAGRSGRVSVDSTLLESVPLG